MTREFIYDQIRQFRLAVLATTSGDHQPEAAVVGIAITRELEIVFDTVRSSRKYHNLIAQPKVALVIGWKNETTIQFEGEVVELGSKGGADRGIGEVSGGIGEASGGIGEASGERSGADREKYEVVREKYEAYLETYYAVFPDGRERAATWEGLTHFVIRPRWIRYSNFNEPVRIEELRF